MKFAKRTQAEMYADDGQLRCDRCGRVVSPWPCQRPEVCSPKDWANCIRQIEPVLRGWDTARGAKW